LPDSNLADTASQLLKVILGGVKEKVNGVTFRKAL